MSVAHTLSLHPVSSSTSPSITTATSGFWAQLRGAVWNFLVSTGRHRGAHAMKHGYYKYI